MLAESLSGSAWKTQLHQALREEALKERRERWDR
jgi:hypothetical protein